MSEQNTPQEFGIKETQELAIGALALGFYIAKKLQDGFQLTDLSDTLDKFKNDPVFAQKIVDAYENMQQVPDEIKDMNLTEGLQLAMAIVPAVIEEMRSM